MKIDGTIPAPQNMRRRESYLLTHKDTLPKTYVQAELLKIAMRRTENRIRFWDKDDERKQKIKEMAKKFTPVPQKKTFKDRVRDWFKPKINRASQRGNQ